MNVWGIGRRNEVKQDVSSFTYHSIDGHVEESPRSADGEDAVNIFEDKNHHFILVSWSWLILGLGREMVEIEDQERATNTKLIPFTP